MDSLCLARYPQADLGCCDEKSEADVTELPLPHLRLLQPAWRDEHLPAQRMPLVASA